jgi:hypothetical protein
MPILFVPQNNYPSRTIGDGVIFTFEGSYIDNVLYYSKVYYHGEASGTQYKNKEEGNKILDDLLKGEKIRINDDSIVICGKEEKIIENNRMIFICPE